MILGSDACRRAPLRPPAGPSHAGDVRAGRPRGGSVNKTIREISAKMCGPCPPLAQTVPCLDACPRGSRRGHDPGSVAVACSDLLRAPARQEVCHLSFSPDERFLLGCGRDRLAYIWDTGTGELVTGKQYPEPATLGIWGAVSPSGRRSIYQARPHWPSRPPGGPGSCAARSVSSPRDELYFGPRPASPRKGVKTPTDQPRKGPGRVWGGVSWPPRYQSSPRTCSAPVRWR